MSNIYESNIEKHNNLVQEILKQSTKPDDKKVLDMSKVSII